MTRDPFEDLAQDLPSRELTPDEVDELVSSVQAGLARARGRRTRRRAAGLALAAAAVATVVLSSWWLNAPQPIEVREAPGVVAVPAEEMPEDTDADDQVWAAAGTRYTLVGPTDDRVVRLEAGRVRCDVRSRQEGGRFRVVVGDDEVEVTGTRFEVTADDEHLQAVEVQEGEVVVRLRDGRTHRLVGGESWSRERPPDPDPAPGRAASAPVRASAPPAQPTPDAAFGIALARYDAGDWAAARTHFAEVRQGPLVADARFWGAMSRVRLARDEGAAQVLDEALRAGVPREREGALRCVLGRLLSDLGRAEEARPHLVWAAADADPAARICGASSQ